MTKDEFYTPVSLARDMVNAASGGLEVSSVADFAAGTGVLLEVAQAKWAPTRVIATDVSPHSLGLLREQHPDWIVGKCDFLNRRSRSASRALRCSDAISLILLNPPFSSRGGTAVMVHSQAGSIQSSRALAFVLCALPYLTSEGEMVALLPAGTLNSQKDAAAWIWLRNKYSVDIVERYGRTAFSGAHARTVLIRLSSRRAASDAQRTPLPLQSYKSPVRVLLTRGNRQMHTLNLDVGTETAKSDMLVHTTDLRGGTVLRTLRTIRRRATDREVCGPAVLLPRVGKPDKDKVVILEQGRRALPSDCVYAICCRDLRGALSVRYRMRREWSRLEELYGGSCAPFLSMIALGTFLDSIGVMISRETG